MRVKSKIVLVVVCGLLLTACASGDSTEPTNAPSQGNEASTSQPTRSATTASTTAGAYISQSDYERSQTDYQGTKIVLFFDAKWCSTCKQARDNIRANPVPLGLTIVDIDFDASIDLRQKYGVTVQHTFVQIDEQGNLLAKWAGSVTADEIAAQTV